MRIVVMAALVAWLCTASPASAALVQWHIDGSITSGTGPYVSPSGPLPVGSAYSANFTVDLNSSYTPSSGSANFEGAIKSFTFSVLQSGFSYSSNTTFNQGVSITPNTPSGDLVYFYMPWSFSNGSEPDPLVSFHFIDPIGTLSANPNLTDLFTSFDLNRYSYTNGHAWTWANQCASCGSIEMSITSANAVVPLPGSLVLMLSGLSGICWLMGRSHAWTGYSS